MSRMLAVIFDLVFTFVLAGLGEWLLRRILGARISGVSSEVLWTAIATLGYFLNSVLLTANDGQSIGKKICGIRVVALEQEYFSSGTPFSRILLRESIWKFFGALFLFYGFWRIVIRSDRSALHDALSRTRVINLHEAQSSFRTSYSTSSRGYGLAVLVFLLLVVSSVGALRIYALRKIKSPEQQLATVLQHMGFKIGHVDGDANSGYILDSLSRESEDSSLLLGHISFRVESVFKEGKTTFIVRELKVQSGSLTIRKLPLWLGGSEGAQPVAEDPLAPIGGVAVSHPLPNVTVKIETGDLRGIDFTVPVRPTYRVERLSLTGVQLESETGMLKGERIWLQSDALLADLQSVLVHESALSIGKSSTMQILPKALPEVLASPVDIRFDGMFDHGKPTQISLNALGDKIKVKWIGDVGLVDISQFTPFHYFKTELPIWNIDLHISGNLSQLLSQLEGADMTGSIGVRNQRFELSSFGFTKKQGKRIFSFQPKLSVHLLDLLSGTEAAATLGTNDKMQAREALAQLFFERPLALLSTSERAFIEHDQIYFTDTPDAVAPRAVPIPVTVVSRPAIVLPAEDTKSVRIPGHLQAALAPTSAPSQSLGRKPTAVAARARGKKSVPDGVPLVLPAYRKKSARQVEQPDQ